MGSVSNIDTENTKREIHHKIDNAQIYHFTAAKVSRDIPFAFSQNDINFADIRQHHTLEQVVTGYFRA